MQPAGRGRKGVRLEHKTIFYYRQRGYTCLRSAGSKGLFDICAFNAHHFVLVQVKANAWPGSEEMDAIRRCPVPPGTEKRIVRWDDYKSLPQEKEVV